MTTDGTDQDNRLAHRKIFLRIDKRYHQEPVISNLVSKFDLRINIASALLTRNWNEDGWFELEIEGALTQINSALSYLNDLDLEVMNETEEDGW